MTAVLQVQRGRPAVVSGNEPPVPSMPPDRPGDQAADADEEYRKKPLVKEALEGPGDLLGRRVFTAGFLAVFVFIRSTRLSAEMPLEVSRN